MPPRARNPVPLSPPPSSLSGVELSRWIIDVCRAIEQVGLGFAAAGVCDARPTEYATELRNWLAEKRQGQMSYLSEQLDERLDPGLVLRNVRSVIMVADLYAERRLQVVTEKSDEPSGRIARYAQGRDYHEVIRRRLHKLADALRATFPTHEFRSFVDTAPVLEREYASRAGLGWRAKNTLIIHPQLGSYMLLGGVFTTLDLPTLEPPTPDHCGTCTRCIDACPTQAISPPPDSFVDARRCISYLTIEHEGPIEPGLAKAMDDWVFGCDVCQEVCPHNSPRPTRDDSTHVRREYRPTRSTLPLDEMLQWRHIDRSVLTVSAMKRATVEMFHRNAVIALGNLLSRTHDPAIRSKLNEIASDPVYSPVLRETARSMLMGT